MLITKWLSSFFYRFEVNWFGQPLNPDWKNVRLVVFLNHTSLFEPLFIKVAPVEFIWELSKNLLAPGADITLTRPILGKFFKLLLPGCVAISRKNDETWQTFLNMIKPESITVILPEGRMMRKDGLDKNGQPMTARGGIADILEKIDYGKVLFVYSGGLHHIQSPGDKFPRFFKKIKVNLELVTIEFYKQLLQKTQSQNFRARVIDDLNLRLKHLIPK